MHEWTFWPTLGQFHSLIPWGAPFLSPQGLSYSLAVLTTTLDYRTGTSVATVLSVLSVQSLRIEELAELLRHGFSFSLNAVSFGCLFCPAIGSIHT